MTQQPTDMSKPPLTTCQRKRFNPSNISFDRRSQSEQSARYNCYGPMKRPRPKPASLNLFSNFCTASAISHPTFLLPWSNNFLLKSAIDISNYRLCLVFSRSSFRSRIFRDCLSFYLQFSERCFLKGEICEWCKLFEMDNNWI